jgi:hypothetical protein
MMILYNAHTAESIITHLCMLESWVAVGMNTDLNEKK